MTIETLKDSLPDYARDLKLNLSSVASEPGLTEQQRWGTLLASALASRNATVIAAISQEASRHLTPEAVIAAKTAAAIMAMNNIYYRFLHLVSDPDYRTMPARLRMNALAKPGVDKADFELWSLAVSAINGCGMCLEAHEHEVRKAGLGTPAVQNAVRIAAVVHAVAATLDGEAAIAA
jgi:alkyl hydroperoxide reductase subunit D